MFKHIVFVFLFITKSSVPADFHLQCPRSSSKYPQINCNAETQTLRNNTWINFYMKRHPTWAISISNGSASTKGARKATAKLTVKYACTLRMWLCTKWHGAGLYGVCRTCQDGSCFMWHQPCWCCEYTTSVDIQKRAIKSYSLRQNHMWAQWVCLRAENSAI